MFGNWIALSGRGKEEPVPGGEVDPKVMYFGYYNSDKSHITFPYSLMTWTMMIFIVMGCLACVMRESQDLSFLIFCIICAFAPLYLPGLYLYTGYFERDAKALLELDCEDEVIYYHNPSIDRKLLFHFNQIERCELHLSQVFPFRIDYLTLLLKGGKKVHISSLIAEPNEVLQALKIPYSIQKKWYNPAPKA